MFRFWPPIIALLILSCSTDAENILAPTLDSAISSKEVVLDNVIACAASDIVDSNKISVFFYPRTGVTNIQYYETEDASVDKNNFDNYRPVEAAISDVFNGYLKKFDVITNVEKWVIVSFDEAGQTHLSNPIRLKQNSKPTEYLPENIAIDATSNMPNFSWQDGSHTDTKIYFQVVSDSGNNLLSGTYTFEKEFQYYSLNNVVLNITEGTPQALKNEASYNFTLMGVSEDNWVNLFSEVPFTVE